MMITHYAKSIFITAGWGQSVIKRTSFNSSKFWREGRLAQSDLKGSLSCTYVSINKCGSHNHPLCAVSLIPLLYINSAPPFSELGPWQIEWLTCIPHSQVLHGLALSGCWWQPSPSLPCRLFCGCQHFDWVWEAKVCWLPPVCKKSPLKASDHPWSRLRTSWRGQSGYTLKNISI